MTKRIINPKPAERTAFGLIAWLEQTKIALPLKGVECGFKVCGDVVSVELDQIFEQTGAQPLDCLYTFPLPAGAAVYRCEMHVNGRVIRAQVEERERARELAREMKAAGRRTALVEMERDNLFTLSLGNLQPGDLVVIRFAYFQALTRLGDWTSFHIPFCPGIRYIPGTPLLRSPKGKGVSDDTDQVPDASRIAPPRIDRLHPDTAYVSVQGCMEHPLEDVQDISSPSHIVLVRNGKGASTVEIAERAAVPDCDFVLRWSETIPTEVRPMGWVARGKGEAYALVRLRAPAEAVACESYEQDIYFLIDRSGSMQGLKWQKAVQAFQEFVKRLGKGDRVWATLFESTFRDLAEKPLPAAEIAGDLAVERLEALGTAGGTELLPALEHVVARTGEHSANRPASLVLITDGEVGNEAHILQRLAQHTHLRVHVFGIDVTLNDGFLSKLAAQNHGSSCLMAPQDDIVGAVSRLGARLRRPVLTNVRVLDSWELAGQVLPDLHAGEVLSVPLKRCGKAPGAETASRVDLEANLPGGAKQTFRFELVGTDSAALELLWSKRRIEWLLAQGRTDDAICLAKQSNLVCEGAAFIAWDEEEKVPVSNQEVYQPAMMFREVCRGRVAGKFEIGTEAFDVCGLEEPSQYLGSARAASARFSRLVAGKRPPLEKEVLSDKGETEPDTPAIMRKADVIAGLALWRKEMEQDLLFPGRSARQLLDCLAEWVKSDPTLATHRLGQLRQLQDLLRATANEPPAARQELVRRWMQTHLGQWLRENGKEKLEELMK